MATIEEILMIKGPDVIVASPDMTVREAVKLMSQANVGSVVVKDGRDVNGIFTERDVLQRVLAPGKDPDGTPLSDVMSCPVKSCRLDNEVSDVAAELTSHHIRHMAIIEQGALVGLVGLRDILAAELREKSDTIRGLRERLGEDE